MAFKMGPDRDRRYPDLPLFTEVVYNDWDEPGIAFRTLMVIYSEYGKLLFGPPKRQRARERIASFRIEFRATRHPVT